MKISILIFKIFVLCVVYTREKKNKQDTMVTRRSVVVLITYSVHCKNKRK